MDNFPHNEVDFEPNDDWKHVFWRSNVQELNIFHMPLKEAVAKGHVKVHIGEHVLQDIKAHNALLEATRAAPMTEEEIEQIKFYAKHINDCCNGQAFSAPIRTSDPTEKEIEQWQADYEKLCNMDVDAIIIKLGVKLRKGKEELIYIDPLNERTSDVYFDFLDINERKKEFAEAEKRDYWN
jgi:hypothetical protein